MLVTRRGLAVIGTLVAIASLGLTSCAVGGANPVQLTSASIADMSCDTARASSEAVNELAGAAAPGKRNQLTDWGLNPDNNKQIEDTLDELAGQIDKACAESAPSTPPSAASSSATPTATTTVTVTASPSAEPEGDATITANDGEQRQVPLVRSVPSGADDSADTRNDPNTPATLAKGVCDVMTGWDSLVSCVEDNNLDWFIQGVNDREGDTGFNWDDVKHWAKARTLDGNSVEARVIEVYGDISKAEARERAAELVGEDAAAQLRLKRHASCFANTRGLEDGQMDDFVYCPPAERQVRVSLVLLRMDGKGHAVGYLDTDSGVFVDCDNVWWIPPVVKTPDNPPQTNPPPPDNPPSGGCVEIPGNGRFDCESKDPAPQPSGVDDPDEGTVGAPQPKPTPKPTPLQPSSSPSGGGGDGNPAPSEPEESASQTTSPPEP